MLIVIVSGYILVVHLLFEELCYVFGKLYTIFTVLFYFNSTVSLVVHYKTSELTCDRLDQYYA